MLRAAPVSLAMAFLAVSAKAGTIHVPADQPTVQAGLAAATFGDVVIVAAGTYVEHDLVMPSGVTLRGNPADPSSVIIDAQQLGRVLSCVGSAASTVIEGVMIMDGLLIAPYPNGIGGGIYCGSGASPQIRSCVFEGNSSSDFGGGLYSTGSAPSITSCVFQANSSNYGGAAAITNGSLAQFVDCQFLYNSAAVVGGAIDNAWYSDGSYDHCVFAGNHGEHGSGGLITYYSKPTVSFCTFFDNSAGTVEYGGAHMLCDTGSAPSVGQVRFVTADSLAFFTWYGRDLRRVPRESVQTLYVVNISALRTTLAVIGIPVLAVGVAVVIIVATGTEIADLPPANFP